MYAGPVLFIRSIGGTTVVEVGDRATGDPYSDTAGPAGLFEGGGRRVVLLLDADDRATLSVRRYLFEILLAARRTGGSLRVCCPPGPFWDVMAVTKLDRIIPLLPTLADALRGG
ncbi:STAS domain-containing protein [Urbifossiella limnaea]|uniref:STAS domain-containing protein n=1 Tax=Urbifossiella limnaea TaxID=2528023 RepID=A0A517XP01_9BACT|nr:hypothetical protein [Urbifossiella limnaea]QDU19241.1 hypothetical protein ETAA1_11450 [Urbifossiella limnaea]